MHTTDRSLTLAVLLMTTAYILYGCTPVKPYQRAYLNDAAMSGLAAVRIVHGKGTGALRQAVREQLAHHPLVKSYTSAPPQEGGDGVTVVKISA